MTGLDPLLQSIRALGVIHPGETLLLTSDDPLTNEQAADIKRRVQELMPDVHVVVTSGLKATVQRDA